MNKDTNAGHILIVDDNSTNIDILVHTLRDKYQIGIAKNGKKALEYAFNYNPGLILLDIMMPDMDGYEVCKRLKEDERTRDIAVIFISAMNDVSDKTKGFELGAVDFITKPFNSAEVNARVKTHLSIISMQEELSNRNIILEKKVAEKTKLINQILDSTIMVMARMAESTDPYTAGHQARVSKLAFLIARHMGLDSNKSDAIRTAGLLHDIGKIRIPVSVLSRPGVLLDEEFDLIRVHPVVSYELLSKIPFPGNVARIAYEHHERLDGSGYPLGISGDEILPESKIVSVADVMEAMSSHRPYRPAKGDKAALDELVKHSGIWYDPEVVKVCVSIYENDKFTFSG